MKVGDHIKLRRKEIGMSQTELADKVGSTKQNIYKYENGIITNIPSDKVEAIAAALSTTPGVLMGWEESSSTLPAPAIAEDVTTFYIQTSVAAHYNAISDDETLEGDKVEIPTSYLHGRKPENFCAMRVNGNSMYPQFQDGDIVIVLKQATLDHSGQIGVICYGDGEMTIKRINYVNGEDWLELIPLNSEFPPKRIEGADLEQCKVIGIPRIMIRNFG